MRGLQLTILITTAVVLFGVAGWAMWHTWQEQELPAKEPESTDDAVRPIVIVLHEDGRLTFGSHELRIPEDEAGRARVEEALRDALRQHLEKRAVDPAAVAVPVVIRAGGDAGVGLVRDACRAAGLRYPIVEPP